MLEQTRKIIEQQNFEIFSKSFLIKDFFDNDIRKKWWDVFFDLFNDISKDDFKKYCLYWPIFVRTTWFDFNKIDRNLVLKLITNQIFAAFMMGVDVKDAVLRYAQLEFLVEDERLNFFKQFKELMFSSDFVWTKIDGKEVVLKELIKEYDGQKNKKQVENLISKIIDQEIPAFEMIIKMFYIDKEIIFKNIEKFLVMMNEIKEENFIQYCDEYNNPLTREKNITEETSEKPLAKPEPTPMAPPSYTEIKNKIIQFFPKDENGEIIDTEGVFEVLEKTANKYNDEKIKELYYFDEATGKFEWSV